MWLLAWWPSDFPPNSKSNSPMFYVYILLCSDGFFYTGFTSDLQARVKAHNEGRGATYTCKRRPVSLVYSETVCTELEAMRRERQLKGWSAKKKRALIERDLGALKALSKSREK